MKKWLLVALGVGGLCFMCTGGVLVFGLLGEDVGGGAAESGGEARATAAGCPNAIDGWKQTIGPSGLVLTRGNLTVELAWPFEITDALRQGDSELNLWNAVLGARYQPGPLQHGELGELLLAGPATERSTGRTVYIAFTSGANSGYANPVAVIGPDEATLRAFPGSQQLLALNGLNRFPLSCAEVQGRWKSGFHTAAERYAVGTGKFLGVEAVGAWRDMTLERGSFRRESKALLNGVFHERVETGRWSHDDWSLVLEPDGEEAIAFDAAFVAVPSGFLLRLANKKFAADVEEFQRVE
jgi:hypothetical protein